EDRLRVVAPEHRALVEHARMREARDQVMAQQPAIERERRGEAVDAGIDAALEPSAPELRGLPVLLGAGGHGRFVRRSGQADRPPVPPAVTAAPAVAATACNVRANSSTP